MQQSLLEEARSALAQHGFPCRRLEWLSPPGPGRKAGRCTVRLELTDGSAGKARRFESAAEAARVFDLGRRAAPVLPPAIAPCGAWLLEAWVDGETLSARHAEDQAEDLGALLGRLHAMEVAAPPVATKRHCARALSELARLTDGGLLPPDLYETLADALRRLDPGESRQTLVHLDYCPENLVIDGSGRLQVIDNEWLRIDAPGLDLGRTYARWPMSGAVWERFLAGYRGTASGDPGPLSFWTIVMAATSARIRMEHGPAGLSAPMARLHELARGSTL